MTWNDFQTSFQKVRDNKAFELFVIGVIIFSSLKFIFPAKVCRRRLTSCKLFSSSLSPFTVIVAVGLLKFMFNSSNLTSFCFLGFGGRVYPIHVPGFFLGYIS